MPHRSRFRSRLPMAPMARRHLPRSASVVSQQLALGSRPRFNPQKPWRKKNHRVHDVHGTSFISQQIIKKTKDYYIYLQTPLGRKKCLPACRRLFLPIPIGPKKMPRLIIFCMVLSCCSVQKNASNKILPNSAFFRLDSGFFRLTSG